MTSRKTERILNLTICLLVSGRYLPKSQIREAVEGYHGLVRHRVRAHLRARQGRAAGAGRPDRGRVLRSAVRRRAGLPDQAVGVRAAARRAGRRRGRRGRVSRPGSGSTPASPSRPRARWPSSAPPGSSRTPPSSPPWSLRSRRARRPSSRCGPRCWIASGFLHLPRRREPHPRAVGDDRVEGPLVRDRPGHRPAGDPDVQADPDHRQAAAGVQARRVRGAGGSGSAGAGPLAGSRASRPDGGRRGPRGKGPTLRRRGRTAADGAGPGPSAGGVRGLGGRLLRSAHRGRGGRPVRAPTWSCWTRPNCVAWCWTC